MSPISPSQKRNIAIATFISIIFAAFFLRSYFSMFFISGVLAFLFWPVYEYFRKKRGQGTAVGLTMLVSALVVIIPIVLLMLIAVSQIRNQIDTINTFASTADLSKVGQEVVNSINNALSHIPFLNLSVTEESLTRTLSNLASSISSGLLNYIKSTATSLFGFFTGLIIFIFVYISALRNGESILRIFKDINPLGRGVSELYISKVAAMVKGTVRGQFIIAVCQGFIGALSLYIAGMHGFFAVTFIIFSAFSIIPLGSGIILIPTGIAMILFGNISGGLVILLTHFIITTNIDNILRPKLVPEEARLDPALMIVSVFSGLKMFGFLGIIIGPTIMIIIVTTIGVYLQVYRDYKNQDVKSVKEKNNSILNKVHRLGNKLAGKE